MGQAVGYVLNALDKVGCGSAYGKVAVLRMLLMKPLPRPTKQELASKRSAVMIVASMLMSPLLGPILAFSFGTSTRDWHMVCLGIAVEFIGLAITFFVGFIAGEHEALNNSFPLQRLAGQRL